MKTPRASLRRYYETIRHLHPEQLRFQVQRRFRRHPAPAMGALRPEAVHESSEWGPRVQRCRLPSHTDVLGGEFRWWGSTRRLDLDRPWIDPHAGASWNYPVHYFEYLPAWADRAHQSSELGGAIAEYLERWIRVHPPGTALAWDAYPIALRIVSWIDVLHTLAAQCTAGWRQQLLGSVYAQAVFLSQNLERHLLGTHLLKDIKALLVAASCFDDARARAWRAQALRLLERELHAQVDANGAHAEPSLMYHCTALEDVLDLMNFRNAVDAGLQPLLGDVARRMLLYARATQTPRGGYPLLGDAWEDGAPSPRALVEYAQRLGLTIDRPVSGSDPGNAGHAMHFFSPSGVAVWRDATTYLLADMGGMGTPHLSAHGHCDSLSFELWMNGQPWIVDSGTWTYEVGEQRHACRSTRAHNTIQVDAREQHEIWEAFRVARRSSVQASVSGAACVEATLTPWFDRALRVRRAIELRGGFVEVRDRVEGSGEHAVCSRFHVHPECDVQREGDRVVLNRGPARVALTFSDAVRFEVRAAGRSQSGHAQGAGEVLPNAVVEVNHHGALPFECTTTIFETR